MRLRLALVLTAAWVSLTVAMWLVPATNFAAVDRVLSPGHRPELAERLEPLAPGEARSVLRHLASEINRRLFRAWGHAQAALALALVALLLLDPGRRLGARLLAAGAAALALALAYAVTPAVRRLGPPLDFVARPFPPEWAEAGRAFRRLHGAYMALDLVKLGLLVALLVVLLRARERPRGWDAAPGG